MTVDSYKKPWKLSFIPFNSLCNALEVFCQLCAT